jgi:hypothetical protein
MLGQHGKNPQNIIKTLLARQIPSASIVDAVGIIAPLLYSANTVYLSREPCLRQHTMRTHITEMGKKLNF